ncbi:MULTISPECIES: alpha/beta hydrolase [unclassified Stenotrophomonas]|uniref:alpha/beta hydrolase n=1 Tax=unclassified Stenotrophomonas TaxID=196198 RepID=UPI003F997BC3
MKKRIGMLILSLTMLVHSAVAAEPEQVAARLLDHLEAGRIAEAEAMFTPQMAQAVPAESLSTLWNSLGTLKSRGLAAISTHEGMQLVLVPLQFSNGRFVAQVVVDKQEKVAGLMLRPATPEQAAPAPANASYHEIDFVVPQARGALPGTLSLPKGEGPFPAVVLVHGSGPQDRDETVGPNRPFLDVARGLAAQGIAVLRYDKRSRARPQDLDCDFSIDDETTDDAVAALTALGADRSIDGKRLFVLGHSQGAMLAPRIAQRSPEVRGVVLWAAPARSLLQIIPEQTRRLLSVDGQLGPKAEEQLAMLDTQIAAALGDQEVEASKLPLGAPQSFWKSIEAVDARGDARSLRKPLLLLHGGRDFQVTAIDWRMWNESLEGQQEVQLREYPALNHLGIAGDGPASPQEYMQPGNVDPVMISDLARWLKAQK